ncbi:MAG: precorrin-3B C(17)-methyltransferase [Eubacterium sp.]|nr:precorrin-3B C(17)-methyltransferase [Eubacterium sp.]
MKRIDVVGMGPGCREKMTEEAYQAMRDSDVIIGYTVYVDLVRGLFPDKPFLTTPMLRETERCRMAFEEAEKGQCVAMICSGDAGVYGMAGLIYELRESWPEVEIRIIPGITAATGGAAELGAPLMHDFAVISLSDRLTPWEKIEKRLIAAASADFAICLYNPSSKKRSDYLQRACEVMAPYKAPDTVCGVVRNIGREGTETKVMSFAELTVYQVDMFTTVFIGNQETRVINGKMVTPRGYRDV